MSAQEFSKLKALAELVGEFIRYWGFRKIHGQLWAVVYLSKRPMSGVELVEFLGVSKALVSPALRELEDEGLLVQVESENAKTKRYAAVEDVEQVIRQVLKRRERPMMEKISSTFQDLKTNVSDPSALTPDRLVRLETMIQSAHLALTMLVESDEMWG